MPVYCSVPAGPDIVHVTSNTSPSVSVIAWKTNSSDVNLASLRYRVLHKVLALRGHGQSSLIFCGAERIDFSKNIRTVVFAKSATIQDLADAHYAKRKGIPVILDLCDNIFHDTYPSKAPYHIAEVFLDLALIADAIVTTNQTLAKIISRNVQRDNLRIIIIPDGVETRALVRESSKILKKYHSGPSLQQNVVAKLGIVRSQPGVIPKQIGSIFSRLKGRMSAFISTQYVRLYALLSRRKVILWFGNAGGAYAKFGLASLADIIDSINVASNKHRIMMLVVSNSRTKFSRIEDRFQCKVQYLDWSIGRVFSVMKFTDVVLLPNSLDDFSKCKSENRALMAIQHGIPVVATKSPPMNLLRDCVYFDDFCGGIIHYLDSLENRQAAVRIGRERLREHYSISLLGKKWLHAIKQCEADRNLVRMPAVSNSPEPKRVLLLLYLIPDLDLLLPLAKALKEDPRFQECVIVTTWLLQSSRLVWEQLHRYGLNFVVIDAEPAYQIDNREHITGASALITAVESNSRPHRLAHDLTQACNEMGIGTYTMQHGLECIGLTYFDSRYSPENVEIAAKTIFIWSEVSSLDQAVSDYIRSRCIPVGITKNRELSLTAALKLQPGPTIAVFENLHWDRYPKAYRQEFITCLLETARDNAGVNFVLKPHPAGRWFTHRRQGEVALPDNVLVIDSRDDRWKASSTQALLEASDAVITTPSTVALDAALTGKPVAIFAGVMNFPRYEPLSSLRSAQDWSKFITTVLDGSSAESGKLAQFLEHITISGDACDRILDSLAGSLNPDLMRILEERSVEWINPLPSVTLTEPLVFSACDSSYLEYAIPLIQSLEVFSPGLTFLLHIVNPDASSLARINEFGQQLKNTYLAISAEYIDLEKFTETERKTYYACSRFIQLEDVLTPDGPSIFCIDADSLFVNFIDEDISDKEDLDVCLVIRNRATDNAPDPLAVAVGSIWLRPTESSIRLIRDVAQDLRNAFVAGNLHWFVDQEVFAQRILSPLRDIRAYNIKRKYADWDFSENSILWSGKGDRKNFDLRYLILQRGLSDRNLNALSARNLFVELSRQSFPSLIEFERKFDASKSGSLEKTTAAQKATIFVPRMDLIWKEPTARGNGLASLSEDSLDLRLQWNKFAVLLAGALGKAGIDVEVKEIPLWSLESSTLETRSNHISFVPHRCFLDFDPGSRQVFYYMQEYFRWVFTLDAKGWSAASSIYPVNADRIRPSNPGLYDEYRERLFSGQLESKFAQDRTASFEDLVERGEVPPSPYIFFPLQIPHDQSILYFSDSTEEIVVDGLVNWAMNKKINVVLKPHPANKVAMETFKQYVDQKKVFWSTGNIHELIAHSAAVFTINSGVGFESLFHARPVVTFGRAEYDCVTFRAGVDSLDQAWDYCTSVSERQLEDKYRQFVNWFLGDYAIDMSNFKRAEGRLAELVSEMITRK